MSKVVFFVRRVGPYHDARFNAAGRVLDFVVVETRAESNEYPWTSAAAARHYQLDRFAGTPDPERGLRGPALAREIARVLREHSPAVMACAGWGDPEYHALLRIGHARGIPAVVMSDSNAGDQHIPRRWWRELLKRSVVGNYAAAVVAGARSRLYLEQLGFSPAAICAPWDTVDNAYFARGVEKLRRETRSAGRDVPPVFLCVARFIGEKNLERLLEAYAGYVAAAGAAAWTLALSGSGPLEAALRAQVARLGLTERVRFLGFRQYEDLPAVYAQAGVLVLPSWSETWGLVVNEAMAASLPVIVSNHCGCADDLVRPGENGWRFDPADVPALQACLQSAAALDRAQWERMGARSREIVADYAPGNFAQALEQAVNLAQARRSLTPPLPRAMLHLLTAREGFSA